MLNNVESLNLRLYGSIDDLKFASIDSYPSNVHVFFFLALLGMTISQIDS